MNVTTDLLNPQGRMGPKPFLKYGLILVGIGFVLSLLTAVSFALGMLLSLLSLVLIYPWVVIWIKRLHDAGHSGWLVLAIVVVYIIVTWIISTLVVVPIFAGSVTQAAMNDAMLAGDNPFAAMTATTRAAAIPSAICTAIVSVAFVFLANVIFKSDPGPNKFGAPQP